MPRVHQPYATTTDDSHATDTSTGTADVKTLSPPAWANGFMLSFETNGARVTFDSGTPAANNGLVYPSAANPVIHPFRPQAIKWVSLVAGNSIAHVLWLH